MADDTTPESATPDAIPPTPEVFEKVARFTGALPDLSDPLVPDDLAPWRDRIDDIDRQILHLLNEREAYADLIGYIKGELGMRAYVPSREAEVLENVVSRNEGPFPDNAIRRIFERIIEETRTLEQRNYEGLDE